MEKAPELGLNKMDRLSKDPQYQIKAIIWLTQSNAKVLKNKGIEVNDDTLYAAHYLGPNATEKIYKSNKSDSIKLEKVLAPKDIRANPWLKNKTIGEFKEFITGKIRMGTQQEALNRIEQDEGDGDKLNQVFTFDSFELP